MSYKIGAGEKTQGNEGYEDLELVYANKGYVLSFFHIPSNNELQFKALLTKFSDNYESTWNDETSAYGRMDPISTFQNTKRTIDIAFDVVAASQHSAKDNLQKASTLISMLYPTYGSQKNNVASITAGPLFRLSFTNFTQNFGENSSANTDPSSNPSSAGLVGKMNGLNFEPSLNDGFFDVKAGVLYPKKFTLSFTYTVFHTSPLGWDLDGKKRTPLFPYGEALIPKAEQTTQQNKGQNTAQQKKAAQNTILGNK